MKIMKKMRRFMSLTVCLLMVLTVLTGCGGTGKLEETGVAASSDSSAAFTQQSLASKPITLTFFAWNQATSVAKTYNEVEFLKVFEKQTGVHIEWIHPVTDDQLNLLIASKDYPDIFQADWGIYPGGAVKAAEDKVIIGLNDLVSQHALNLTKYFAENPDIKKTVVGDDGQLYCFPMNVPDTGKGYVWEGPLINKTWLDKLGLNVPVTLEDWETVLKAFKTQDPNGNKKADEIPFISLDPFSTDGYVPMVFYAFGLKPGLYSEKGIIKYGPLQPGYRQALEVISKWYENGWLDNNFVTDTWDTFATKLTGAEVGATFYWGNFDRKNGTQWVGAPYPVLTAGSKPMFEIMDPAVTKTGYSLSTKNKYPVESVKWLDYFYGNEGALLANYGIEGLTYKMVDGKPKFTDMILKNPDGLDVYGALEKYTAADHAFPKMQMVNAMAEAAIPAKQAALNLWNEPADIEPIVTLTLTADELTEFSAVWTDIGTYEKEMLVKFIMGKESLDNVGKFVERLKQMGAENAIKIQQAAIDRYNAKK